VEPASEVMALRVWKTEQLTPLQAQVGLLVGVGAYEAAPWRPVHLQLGMGAAFVITCPPPPPSPPPLQTRLRKAVYDAIRSFQARHGLREVRAAIDIGCSVGVSTRWLAAEWPQAAITGLDLSPHFLAVAELRERQQGGGGG
jgi:hypothetical protein